MPSDWFLTRHLISDNAPIGFDLTVIPLGEDRLFSRDDFPDHIVRHQFQRSGFRLVPMLRDDAIAELARSVERRSKGYESIALDELRTVLEDAYTPLPGSPPLDTVAVESLLNSVAWAVSRGRETVGILGASPLGLALLSVAYWGARRITKAIDPVMETLGDIASQRIRSRLELKSPNQASMILMQRVRGGDQQLTGIAISVFYATGGERLAESIRRRYEARGAKVKRRAIEVPDSQDALADCTVGVFIDPPGPALDHHMRIAEKMRVHGIQILISRPLGYEPDFDLVKRASISFQILEVNAAGRITTATDDLIESVSSMIRRRR